MHQGPGPTWLPGGRDGHDASGMCVAPEWRGASAAAAAGARGAPCGRPPPASRRRRHRPPAAPRCGAARQSTATTAGCSARRGRRAAWVQRASQLQAESECSNEHVLNNGMSGVARQQAEGAVAGASHLHAALGAAEICRRRVPLRTVFICNKHSVILWGALPQSADLSSLMRADNRHSSKQEKLGLEHAAKDPLQWHLGSGDRRNRSGTCAAETDTAIVVLVTIVTRKINTKRPSQQCDFA